MFILKVVFVYLCSYRVQCEFNDSSDGEAEYDDSEESIENQVISKEFINNWKVNSTIETSVCNNTESMDYEEVDEYINTIIDYPYVASIQRQGSHYANGALVDKRWILSTASEFYNVRESIKLFRVRLGSVDCKRGGKIFPIKAVQIHPFFVFGTPNYDLALLRLAESIVMRPIPMSEVKGIVVSAKFLTAYWPRIVVNGKVLPSSAKERVKFSYLRVSTQKLISRTQCAKRVKNLSNSSICLKPVKSYHSICTPDSGAPVVAKDGLWGITSGWVSAECLSKPVPTIVTRVATAIVRSWIDSQILTS